MKALRWTEIILPLLAAREFAPWLIEPRPAQARRAKQLPPTAAAPPASGEQREPPRLPFDDLQ